MDDTDCGLDVSLAVMGGKWKPLILYHLRLGPRRFGELRRLVAGVSEKVLIQQLRELVEASVLMRRDYQEVPPKVDYAVTPFGQTLIEALMPLCAWGNAHRTQVEMNGRAPIGEGPELVR
ncbi:DNA-binding HxlR family transcriptional regulator [Aureimonas jatrophae]|uniref:DNA-binding transcriptional regulator, HxlR family n=2 Tax=Aureimonas jatrophae TaxID=1166073 RepID=A0A1H0DIV9_9HYPH|nr:helix-turn-helix domain-containing protein [Aureimonas jatrophae]MBB3951915.1 DNA-binding HxlR family transcriptional regulator [Aureimonas jatrophae]SDN69999.1 DNA-binding transcriptional regulator, HxlR family [Aureimonas jatrophae]